MIKLHQIGFEAQIYDILFYINKLVTGIYAELFRRRILQKFETLGGRLFRICSKVALVFEQFALEKYGAKKFPYLHNSAHPTLEG